MTENKRLTDEDLAVIRKRAEKAREYGEGVFELVFEDVPALLAEIERLTSAVKTIAELTSCDDTFDFANRTMAGKEKITLPYRFSVKGGEDSDED